jgi:serine/threonine protein kinase
VVSKGSDPESVVPTAQVPEGTERCERNRAGAPTVRRRPREDGRRAVPTSPAHAPGSKIGRFELERVLGQGGMGTVFVARDPKLQRLVALKLLRTDTAEGERMEAQQRMLREAQAMAMVSHPSLVTIFEVGTHRDDVFLAMEYVVGRTLGEWLDDAPRPLEVVVEMFRQIGHALQAVHDAGLVHRDLKPENVLVTEAGRPTVLDFGIARLASPPREQSAPAAPPAEAPRPSTARTVPDAFDSQLTRRGTVVGTPQYMAPEQLMGRSVEPAADQWALASALFEALTGDRPFSGADTTQMLEAMLAGERRPWTESSDVPPGLRHAIERALSVEPGDRFDSIAEFVEACHAALGLRSQLGFLTDRWVARGRTDDYLLPDGELLQEGELLLSERPHALTGDNRELVRESLRVARRRKLQRRAVLGGMAALALGAMPGAWLLERRERALQTITRRAVRANITSVRASVESIFRRAETEILRMYAQRGAWLPDYRKLRIPGTAGETAAQGLLIAALTRLNAYFRPVIESEATISSLMVASDDGMEYLVFDDPDARHLDPPYRFYNRLVRLETLGDSAFELFWPVSGPQVPRPGWLHPGQPDARGQRWTGYHPTRRPWFRNAVERGEGAAVAWTHPYLFFVTKDAGITGSVSWLADGRRHVLGVDFMLTDISRAMADLEDPGFWAFVTTATGEVVALPARPDLRTPADIRAFFAGFDQAQRLARAQGRAADEAAMLPQVEDLQIPALAEAHRAATTASDDVFSFAFGDQVLWAGRAPIRSPGQELTVYVVEKP